MPFVMVNGDGKKYKEGASYMELNCDSCGSPISRADGGMAWWNPNLSHELPHSIMTFRHNTIGCAPDQDDELGEEAGAGCGHELAQERGPTDRQGGTQFGDRGEPAHGVNSKCTLSTGFG